jgi:hypothetical protein
MSQRAVEAVIGRLVTDEISRREFREDPLRTVAAIAASARRELTSSEQAVLAAMPPEAWERVAASIDPRLQRAALAGTEDVTDRSLR